MRFPPELVLSLAGALLLAVSLLAAMRSRVRRRRDVRRMLEAALRDPDPAMRRAAVLVAAQHGIAPVAELLVDATLSERDPYVLDGIAEAVARNQWEPTEGRPMLVLRLWAQRRVEARQGGRESRPLPEDERV